MDKELEELKSKKNIAAKLIDEVIKDSTGNEEAYAVPFLINGISPSFALVLTDKTLNYADKLLIDIIPEPRVEVGFDFTQPEQIPANIHLHISELGQLFTCPLHLDNREFYKAIIASGFVIITLAVKWEHKDTIVSHMIPIFIDEAILSSLERGQQWIEKNGLEKAELAANKNR